MEYYSLARCPLTLLPDIPDISLAGENVNGGLHSPKKPTIKGGKMKTLALLKSNVEWLSGAPS